MYKWVNPARCDLTYFVKVGRNKSPLIYRKFNGIITEVITNLYLAENMPYTPKFTITPKVATCLMRVEAAKQAVQDLPIMPSVLATLRETARSRFWYRVETWAYPICMLQVC